MFSNKNIAKYCSKYFFLMIGSAYVFTWSSEMVNAKNDAQNVIGSALFAGLFVGWLLVLKSDVTKFVTSVNNEKQNNNENK